MIVFSYTVYVPSSSWTLPNACRSLSFITSHVASAMSKGQFTMLHHFSRICLNAWRLDNA